MKSQLTLVKSLLALAGVAAVSAVSAAPASAFGFGNIVGGDTPGDAYKNSFTFDVLNDGSSVIFKIKNSGNAAALSMFISKVFFDDNGYLSGPIGINVNNVGTVEFSGGAGNDQLPQGGNSFTTNYAFSREGPGNAKGIQAGETLGLKFTGNYNNVIYALSTGALRLGIHVQSLPNGASDAYISTNTQDTPEPLTMLAAGAAVGFGTMFKKQRERAAKSSIGYDLNGF